MSPIRTRALTRAIFTSIVLLTSLFIAPQVALAAPAATSSPAVASTTWAQMTAAVFADTNRVRFDAGVGALVRSSALDKVAADWAYQQWKNGSMSHNPNYSTQIPDGWTLAGENVARGYSYRQVVDAWVASPSHYANLVRDFTSVGIGYYEADGKRYWSQVFATYPGTNAPAEPQPAPPTEPAPTQPAPEPAPSTPPVPAPAPSDPPASAPKPSTPPAEPTPAPAPAEPEPEPTPVPAEPEPSQPSGGLLGGLLSGLLG